MDPIRKIIKEELEKLALENQKPWEARTDIEKCMDKLNLWKGIAHDHNQKLEAIKAALLSNGSPEQKILVIQKIILQVDN